MTRCEEIMRAVASLVKSGKVVFARQDVRDEIGVSRHEWLQNYTAIFQGMRVDQPGGAPEVNPRFKGVFERVEYGKYVLTPYGKNLLKNFVDRVLPDS